MSCIVLNTRGRRSVGFNNNKKRNERISLFIVKLSTHNAQTWTNSKVWCLCFSWPRVYYCAKFSFDLQPCVMCVGWLHVLGVHRVYYSVSEEKDACGGSEGHWWACAKVSELLREVTMGNGYVACVEVCCLWWFVAMSRAVGRSWSIAWRNS